MQNLVLAIEHAVFLAQRVERMRVRRHDAAECTFLELLDIGSRQGFEHAFVANAAHVVACVALGFEQDAEIDARSPKQAGDVGRDLLSARIVGSKIADKPEYVDRLLERVLDRKAKILGPARALPRRLAEGIAVLLQIAERALKHRLDGAGLDHGAPHIDDLCHLFDMDRADVHAGAAGGARPQRLHRDGAANQRSGAAWRCSATMWSRKSMMSILGLNGSPEA